MESPSIFQRQKPPEPPWNSWLFAAARDPEQDLAPLLRAELTDAVKALAPEAPKRFAKLLETLAKENPTAVDWIEGLIAAGATPNAAFHGPHTALAAAAAYGWADRVAALLPHSGAGRVSAEGWTALSRAAAMGRAECVRLILPATDDAALAHAVRGDDALMMATKRNHAECVEILLTRCDARRKEPETGCTPLMRAAEGGYAQCLALLLPCSDPKEKDALGRDALMCAAIEGRLDCLLALLPRSDPLAVDNLGFSALMLALDHLEPECASALLPHSDASARALEGEWTALAIAADHGLAPGVKMLLANSALPPGNADEREALRRALDQEAWACADLFAERMPLDLLQSTVLSAPAGALPAMLAVIERAALAQEIDQAPLIAPAPKPSRRI